MDLLFARARAGGASMTSEEELTVQPAQGERSRKTEPAFRRLGDPVASTSGLKQIGRVLVRDLRTEATAWRTSKPE